MVRDLCEQQQKKESNKLLFKINNFTRQYKINGFKHVHKTAE